MANEQSTERDSKTASNSGKQAGGRSEQNAQQRNKEQANAGQDGEKIPPVPNVRSEPHWDPTEPPPSGGEKANKSRS